MKKALMTAALLVGSCSPTFAGKGAFKCETGSQKCVINIATETPSKDEKTSGPKKIIVKGANTLRYDYVFNPDVSFKAGPSIDVFQLGNITQTPAPTAQQKQQNAAAFIAQRQLFGLDGAGSEKVSDEEQLNTLEENTTSIVNQANTASSQATQAGDDLRGFLTNSDNILRIGEDALLVGIRERVQSGDCPSDKSKLVVFQKGICANWPPSDQIQQLLAQATALKTHIAQERSDANSAAEKAESDIKAIDINRAAERSADIQRLLIARNGKSALVAKSDDQLKRLDAVIKALNDSSESGKNYKDFVTAKGNLTLWNERMIALAAKKDPFTLPVEPASCKFAFSQTKTIKETLVRTDLLSPNTTPPSGSGSDSKSAKDSASTTNISLITVECTSPFQLSAGFAFSGITERDFVIQPVPNAPNSTSTTNRFTTDAHSNFHPLPVAMVNLRYYELNDFLSLHGSFGVAANIKNQSAGGSDPEYLFSPITLGFFRTAFVTPALHIGREVRLGSGFHEGDVVPPNVTTPPLQKSYKPTFALAITFGKP